MTRHSKTIGQWMLAMMVGLTLTACTDEETPAPFDGEEPVLGNHSLPQGSHDYDQTILEWNQRYNVLPLYRFDDKDWYWGVTQDHRVNYDPRTDQDHGGYVVVQADEDYVGQQLELIEDCVLRYFPETLLREILPIKLLLASDILHDPASMKGRVPVEEYTHENTLSGFDYVMFAGGSSSIADMTDQDRAKYKADGLAMLFDRAIDNGVIAVPEAFAAVSDYTASYSSATAAYKAGLLSQYGSTATYDLKTYVRLMTTTSYDRIMTQYLMSYPLILQKYELVKDFFEKQYGMDLQAIGNGEI